VRTGGAFLWKNPPLFNNFHRVFNILRGKVEKQALKSAFLTENCVENPGKTVEYPFFAEKPVENRSFFVRCTAN
jgi:hypothetical protein